MMNITTIDLEYCEAHELNYVAGDECPECAKQPAKGEAMPQTIEAWQRLYGLAEEAMKRQDIQISMLKQQVKKLDNKKQRNRRKVKELESQIAGEWISVETALPPYGEPVLIACPTVQNIIYMLDGADDVPDWFEPYFFDHDNELKIGWNKPTHWANLPKGPAND